MTRDATIAAVALAVGVIVVVTRRLGKTLVLGRVVDHQTHDDTGTRYFTAVFEYRAADGVLRRAPDDVSLGAPLALDATVPLLVDRRDPTRVSVARNTLGPLPDWLVFVAIPAVALAVAWLRRP